MRNLLVLLGLLAGLLIGGLAYRGLNPAPPLSPYPSYEAVAEPAGAGFLRQAVNDNDATLLSQLLTPADLATFGQAIDPITAVREMTFAGAAHDGQQVWAGYVVVGKTKDGLAMTVGLVLHFNGTTLVGIN